METNQKQASTVGQPKKNILGPNGPVQNCVRESTSIGKLPDIIPGLKARYSKGSPLQWPTSPVKDKERFSFKDCKAWNIYRAELVDIYIMGNINPDYTGCAVLDIPDDPHPWNTLRSVIEQFYQREKDIAKERIYAHEAIEKASKQEERIQRLDRTIFETDDIILELKKELKKPRDNQSETKQRAEIPARLNLLDELLDISNAGEWIDAMGSILDCVIGLSCYDGNAINGSDLYFTRRLQEFFMKLDKVRDPDVDNHNIKAEDTDPASKNI